MAAAKRAPQGRTIGNIDEVLKNEELSPEEEAALEGSGDEEKSGAAKLRDITKANAGAIVQDVPAWVKMPPGLIIPKGVEVSFMKLPTRTRGEIQIIIWELSVRDERLARARAMGDGTRLVEEMAKQMIRSIDDEIIGWADPIVVERAWDEIGSKYRNMLVVYYLKAHQLEDEERVDFFANRVVARRAV